jgi:phage tail-like protein
MAVMRDHPYNRFNFLVDFGSGSDGPDAGFAEVSGLDSHVDVIEYRVGNSKVSEPTKLTGLTRVSDVSLRRGLIGSLMLWQWFDAVRNGDQTALRTVTIQLQNEDRSATVMTWKLQRARPIKHVSGPLDAKGTDVAIEELVLAYERLELE